ncbi:MAG TPA: helix-turn-helix transcriptional regulator [Bacteriovoracaceae bacterium]|nr:helix-turn-helix transcriptional regulator [Bacteriovoracaceae bacterium]
MTTKNTVKAKKAIRKITGPISFGEMLSSFRLAHEHSQVALAEVLGISKQELCNIEKGRKLVSVERAKNFAEALGMPSRTFAKYALQDQLNSAGIEGEVEINEVA